MSDAHPSDADDAARLFSRITGTKVAATAVLLAVQPLRRSPSPAVAGPRLEWHRVALRVLDAQARPTSTQDLREAAAAHDAAVAMDLCLIRLACRWAASQPPPQRVSVELSASTLADVAAVDPVLDLLRLAHAEGISVCLELPSEQVLADPWQARRSLGKWQRAGAVVAMSGIGAAAAPLNLALHGIVSAARLDRSVVFEAAATGDRRLLDALLQLVSTLGMEAVVDGVDSAEMTQMLEGIRCWMQGFHVAPPRRVPVQTGCAARRTVATALAATS